MDRITEVNISFKTENAAFDDDARPEIARILRGLADRIEDAGLFELMEYTFIKDINGNTIGDFHVDGELDEDEDEEEDE